MRWLTKFMATVLVALLLLGGMVLLMPKDGVGRLAAERFRAATGRPIQIDGGFTARLWPLVGVRTGPVRIAHAAGGDAPDLLRASAMDIGLDVAAMMSGKLQITAIRLHDAELVVERDSKGAINWASPGTAPADETVEDAFSLGAVVIRDGTLRLIDRISGTDLRLDALQLDAELPAFHGLMLANAAASLNGQNLRADIALSDAAATLQGAPADLDLTLQTGAAALHFSGTAGLAPLQAEGAMVADFTDTAALAALAGLPPPTLPKGLGAESLTLEAQMRLQPDRELALSDAVLAADGQQITGALRWRPAGERPRLDANLDLGAFTLPGTTAPSGNAPAQGWPTAALDVTALDLFDASVDLTAQSLAFGNATLGPTHANLTLDRARAVLTLQDADAYGGTAAGSFVVNGRKGLSVGGDLRFKGLTLEALFADVAGFDRLTGRGDVRLKFLGIGNSVDAIMHSLSGDGEIRMGKGEMLGLDLPGMLRAMDPGYVGPGRKTAFDSLSFSFTLNKGVAEIGDLAIASPQFSTDGAGTLDIGGQSVTYRLLPRLPASPDGAPGIEVPVLISGPWSDPEVRLDLEWLGQQRQQAERQRAEDLARQRLQELSGATPAPGD